MKIMILIMLKFQSLANKTGGVKTPITMPKLRHNKKYNNNKQLTKGTQ